MQGRAKRPVTRRQVSAGGVVYRRVEGAIEVALVCVRRGGMERWVLPKGLVGEGESLEEAALREVREEAGLEAVIEGAFEPVDFWYYWPPSQRRHRYHKTVHYYLMRYVAGETRFHDHEVEEARWFPLAEAATLSAYASDRRLLQEVEAHLGAQPSGEV